MPSNNWTQVTERCGPVEPPYHGEITSWDKTERVVCVSDQDWQTAGQGQEALAAGLKLPYWQGCGPISLKDCQSCSLALLPLHGSCRELEQKLLKGGAGSQTLHGIRYWKVAYCCFEVWNLLTTAETVSPKSIASLWTHNSSHTNLSGA